MGNSGKFAVITGIVAAGLLVLTGMTLAMPVFVAFAGVLGLAYLACILELILRRRHVMLVLGGLFTSLAIAGSLAFLGTWELSFEGQSSLIGTPLPTDDPDTYFVLAAGSLVAAIAVLFTGAIWPGRAPAGKTQRKPQARRAPVRQGTKRPAGQRNTQARATQPRPAQPRTTAGGRAPVRQTPSSAQRQGAAQRQGSTAKARAKPGAAASGAAKQTPPKQPARKPAPRR
ncbi:hypothetical protein ACFWIX_13800 [Pseudarthrobacter sp. NPDC058362]|uniref:hypothetical protein n=1 Tax=Pseudarthrobacter sp. NPDC058362 TaxID=3346458 RepID=UPI00365F6C29